MLTTQRQVRKAFWQAARFGYFQPLEVTPRRITNYSGNGKMHNTDRIISTSRANWLRD
jgi:hypothetical protein